MPAATIFDRVLFCGREAVKGTSPFTVTKTFASTVTDVTGAITANALNPTMQAVKVRSVKVAPAMTSIDRPIIKGSMGNAPNIIGKKMVQVDVEVELRGSGVAGTAPEFTPLLEACGLTPTLVAATSVTFNPSATTVTLAAGVTLRVFYDNMLYEVTGCAGTGTIDMTIGNIILATLTFQGAYAVPTPAVIGTMSTVPFDNSSPIVGGVTDVITDGGGAVKAAAFSMDIGNDVQEHYIVGDHQFSVANRNPTLTLTKDSVGTAAEWAALAGATNGALHGAFATGGAGNTLTFDAPAGRRASVAYGERAERDTLDITYGLFETAGNDQFSLTLT